MLTNSNLTNADNKLAHTDMALPNELRHVPVRICGGKNVGNNATRSNLKHRRVGVFRTIFGVYPQLYIRHGVMCTIMLIAIIRFNSCLSLRAHGILFVVIVTNGGSRI